MGLFDEEIDRRGTGSTKWDMMDRLYGVDPKDGLAMWTADSDYPTAPCVTEALRRAADFGVFGYFCDHQSYTAAVAWWMRERHGWEIEPDWIVPTQGLGHAIAQCVDLWTEPDAAVAIFTPVYHEFRNKTERLGRSVTECPLVRVGDRYELDLDAAEARLTGKEQILLWCSPQNPSGRVWTPDELRAVAAFAERNALLLVSDEVHHDFVFAGSRFVPMHTAAPEAEPRLVVAAAASKTFNIAGQKTGNLIIPDAQLRDAMRRRLAASDYQPAMLGLIMTAAAYSPEGAAWVDAQTAHLDANRALFDDMVRAIPGLRSLPLESTYLAWVDFSGTGLSFEAFDRRVREDAGIAASAGPSFGAGGRDLPSLQPGHHTDPGGGGRAAAATRFRRPSVTAAPADLGIFAKKKTGAD